jgi:hypothetical protein
MKASNLKFDELMTHKWQLILVQEGPYKYFALHHKQNTLQVKSFKFQENE